MNVIQGIAVSRKLADLLSFTQNMFNGKLLQCMDLFIPVMTFTHSGAWLKSKTERCRPIPCLGSYTLSLYVQLVAISTTTTVEAGKAVTQVFDCTFEENSSC